MASNGIGTDSDDTASHVTNAREVTLRRVIVAALIIAPMIYALVVNLSALDDPPAWDSAVTVSPAAVTIVDHDFDVWEVAQLPSSPEGGPSTHATSIFTIGLGGLIALIGPSTAFYVAHVVSIALVGALAAGTYLLARERTSVPFSALAAIAVSILPLVVQQAADIYIDLPLAVVAVFACWTACRRWFWWTASLVLIGVAIKTSGVFLLPLLLFAKPLGRSVRRHLTFALITGFVASLPLLATLATTHRFSTDTNPLGDVILIRSSASLLVLTTDVFIVLSLYVLVTYGRVRARRLDRVSQATAILVSTFFAVHLATILLSGTIAMLPRYYIAVLPAILAAIVPGQQVANAEPRLRRVGAGLTLLLVAFSIANIRGDFYPLPDHDFYVAAERSTRAQDLLALHVLGTQELVALDLPLLVERQVHFRLEYPEMGYVEDTPGEVTPVFIDPVNRLPDRFAMLIERRFTNPLVEIEEAVLSQGYDLEYRHLNVGPYESELIVATK